MNRWGVLGSFAVAAVLLAGCEQVNSAVDGANGAVDKVSACTEALGLADLNPLVDPQKIKARAVDKEKRLRELAGQVQDQQVKNALVTMADSYVEVQKERFEDLGVVGKWAERNVKRLDALRKACG
ncbi:hypothetical protein [Amycolatopsis sp. H20-H5]|uniref:hypothetical protein n=1 Tax=Amycolatopsis sp. H20-H5 TaxID=3046309 RepID=UPI002DBF7E1F|nr:hypothetical protein [Amycolatopsis sp. H20-H5]MEC3975065.1 hypothetical protein [Amycolatopsis sp. H20-H5]